MKKNTNITGDRIRSFRQLRKYSQSYMAERLGITESTYGDIERTGEVGVIRIKEIAQLLEVPVKALITEHGPTITFINGTFEIGYVQAQEFQHGQMELVERIIFPLVEKLFKPIHDELEFMKQENARIFSLFEKSVLGKT
ncbi:MAG: helix-turn-helix transcriptional regulator [Flavobacteriales bacterium]|nr:helix-turn-helix transcriptional regulator [Flavobacteriales bacterium]